MSPIMPPSEANIHGAGLLAHRTHGTMYRILLRPLAIWKLLARHSLQRRVLDTAVVGGKVECRLLIASERLGAVCPVTRVSPSLVEERCDTFGASNPLTQLMVEAGRGKDVGKHSPENGTQ